MQIEPRSTIQSCSKRLLFIIFMTFCTLMNAASITTGKSTIITSCGELGDCGQSIGCMEKCGCDRIYYYNETENACVLDKEYLRQMMVEQFDIQVKIRNDDERVFQGIIVSVMLFISCTGLCVITACIYCCHVNYTDRRLRKDVRALAEKLHRDGKLEKVAKKRLPAVAESCNVMVEDAGVFVC